MWIYHVKGHSDKMARTKKQHTERRKTVEHYDATDI